MPPEAALRAQTLDRFGSVPERTREDLQRFVALLIEWQRVHNLVSHATLDAIWTRHVADSLQLLDLAPAFGEWIDLGSGAGFPGLVVAIAAKERDAHFTLVESNLKKAAFLRAAIRETGAHASVAAERVETHAGKMAGRGDVVSARALAPLSDLCRLAAPYLHAASVLLLLKGQDFVHEIDEASKSWSFDVVAFESATNRQGRILAIRALKRKAARP